MWTAGALAVILFATALTLGIAFAREDRTLLMVGLVLALVYVIATARWLIGV